MPYIKKHQRILIVDDDKFVLQILAKILQKAGCEVNSAETGQEALRKLGTQTCDAAVIDVKLQDMNGLDLLSKIHKIAPDIMKIILTGYPSDEDRNKALALGADYYFVKPIKPASLIEIVRALPNP